MVSRVLVLEEGDATALLADPSAELSGHDPVGDASPAGSGFRVRRVHWVVGMVLLGGAALASYVLRAGPLAATGPSRSGLRGPMASRPVGLAETYTRNGVEYKEMCGMSIDLQKVIHNNLGNAGPDSGEEGIQWMAEHEMDGVPQGSLIAELHAVTAYVPHNAEWNGLEGKFGTFNMPTGKEAKFLMRFLDAKTMKPKLMPEVTVTFYDLDQAAPSEGLDAASLIQETGGAAGREWVRTYGHHAFHTTRKSKTQVQEKHTDNRTYYMSTQVGTFRDNPSQPDELTQLQTERAVAFQFKEVHEVTFDFGSTLGPGFRASEFALLNTFNCKEVKVASATPSTATPTVAPKVAPATPTVAPKVAPATPTVAPKVAPATPTVAPKVAPATPTVAPKVAPAVAPAKPFPWMLLSSCTGLALGGLGLLYWLRRPLTTAERQARIKHEVIALACRADVLNSKKPVDSKDPELVMIVERLRSYKPYVRGTCGATWNDWSSPGTCQVCKTPVVRAEQGLHCAHGGHRLCWKCMCRTMDWDKLVEQDSKTMVADS